MRWLAVAFAFALTACQSTSRDPLAVGPRADAGIDASDASVVDAAEAGPDASGLGAPCTDDKQCDDAVPCTFDTCDPLQHRCRSLADDSLCDDGVYCNGREVCVPAHGCGPGAVESCEDGLACTIDRCIESSKSCEHATRDADGDGDPDDHCDAKHDCDDLDPTVASTHAEVCGNGKDDNCDGQVDESPCVTSSSDTCATALTIDAPGTYALSTLAAKKDYATSCSVPTPAAAQDVVATIVIPPGGAKDLEVWGTVTNGQVAIAIEDACGDSTSELACAAYVSTSSQRARARSLAPGTYYVIVTTQVPGSVELRVELLDPTTKPTNESCAAPAPIVPNVATTVSIVDPAKDLVSACLAGTGELTYAFTLDQPADVRVFASTLTGNGAPLVGLRNAHCTDAADELRCRAGSVIPLFARSVPAGTWILTVAATAPIDASIVVKTYPPTTAPPNQTCATSPALAVNATTPVDLSNQEDAIKDGCLPGCPTAGYDLSLAATSDVMLIGRFPQNDIGGISLDTPACTQADVRECGTGSTPVRVNRRGLAAGDYRVVVADGNGAHATLSAYVRDTVPPILVTGGDACTSSPVIDIPSTGAFLTGDTTNAVADFDDACDTPSPAGGANDQVLRLVLGEARHVIFDMSGSTYPTILDIRQGATCPGIEVSNACYVGYSGSRSFLDLQLPAATYWVVIDGFGGSKGAWNLDVRVLAP